MNALTWLFFFVVVAGFLSWIVGGIIRTGNRKAAASKKLDAQEVDKAREASEYRAYLAGVSDPRD